jgi:hypothetical protein
MPKSIPGGSAIDYPCQNIDPGGQPSGALYEPTKECDGEMIDGQCFGQCPQGYEPDMEMEPAGMRCVRFGYDREAAAEAWKREREEEAARIAAEEAANKDTDGDGIKDGEDHDIDDDGIHNEIDEDDDGDGIHDAEDADHSNLNGTPANSDIYNRALQTQYIGDVFYKDPSSTTTTAKTPAPSPFDNTTILIAVGLAGAFMYMNRR